MRVEEYRQTLHEPLRQATLCFLVKDNKVLLAMKKRGFGVGKYNGVGGKKNSDESIEDAAKREASEEIGVTVEHLEQVATLNFYFPHNKNWGQQVIVFLVNKWRGNPSESDEMMPQWFSKSEMPLDKMWPDDEYWLPLVLEGKRVEGEFLFGEKEEIIDHQLKVL